MPAGAQIRSDLCGHRPWGKSGFVNQEVSITNSRKLRLDLFQYQLYSSIECTALF